MKYIVVAFWSLVLGIVGGYITGQLTQQTFNFIETAIFSIIIGEAAAILIPSLSNSAILKKNKKQTK